MAAGTIGGAMMSSSSAKAASEAQAKSAQNSLDFQRSVFSTLQQNAAPYMGVGKSAADTLSQIYGWGGAGGASGPDSANALASFTNTPDYKFTFGQGVRALDMSAAANHTLNTGGMGRALTDYGQGAASTQYGNVIQRLISMMTLGANAGQGLGTAGVGLGSNVNTANSQLGQAQAGGIVGQANPWINAMNTGPGNILAGYQSVNSPYSGIPKMWGGFMDNSSGGGGNSMSSYTQPYGIDVAMPGVK